MNLVEIGGDGSDPNSEEKNLVPGAFYHLPVFRRVFLSSTSSLPINEQRNKTVSNEQ